MKIKNIFTGIVTNERADIARALIRQGMAEAVPVDAETEKRERFLAANPGAIPPGGAAQSTYEWSVTLIPWATPLNADYKVLAIKLIAKPGGLFYSTLPPKQMNEEIVRDLSRRYRSGFPLAVPDYVLKLYRKQWDANEGYRMPAEPKDTTNADMAKLQGEKDEKVRRMAELGAHELNILEQGAAQRLEENKS